MKYNRFGRLDWEISQVGYGMWGMVGWSGGDLNESNKALDLAVEMGCNFFDTAWAYGAGKSEEVLANLLKRQSKKLYVATKIPPNEDIWPPRKDAELKDVFPSNHIIEYTEKSLQNLGVDCIDLLQFHVWEDAWADNDEWKEAIIKLKKEGKIQGFGISTNRWEPANCLRALDSGLIDSVQTIYNIFDQSPEDELLPYCKENDIAVIARVPFDEGSLTGTISYDSKWEEGDFRNIYFGSENLIPTVDRVARLREVLPEQKTLAETALEFIAQNENIATMIPGMRRIANVEKNMIIGDSGTLDPHLFAELKKQRWDRVPTSWSC